ncbi:hypothetical protein IC235_08745 [Hymenobacter sp. BT664]|uniref:Uncharacterized protein n=1 Tax=Hymenobacter montanus TaxID=2771359 RepID=A0A927GJB4_9BACT|nr:hypothetical protein [Hymenobacter montanus]MBD2767979.1 hypothetical protein [Hymenobacter montanus]
MPSGHHNSPGEERAPSAFSGEAPAPPGALPPETTPSQRHRLSGAVATAAIKLLPLMTLLESIRPQVANESVFRTRRKKIRAHFDLVYEELQVERPRHQALAHAFQALAELVREETRDISRDELKQAAKEVVLATLKNAPALLNAAHQARLLS